MKSQFRIFLFLLCLGVAFTSCHSNTETTAAAPKDFHSIPPWGIGGDSLLNIQKNRWIASQNFTDVTVSDIINMPHDTLSAMGSEERYKWTSAASAQASASESRAVRLTGYIYYASEAGNETCNGDTSIYHDFHIWIVDSIGKDKSKAIIVEATPFWKEKFSSWQLAAFEQLAKQNAQVRVSGFIMWDEDHPDELDTTRVSLWEVHPITKFEVFSGGTWQNL